MVKISRICLAQSNSVLLKMVDFCCKHMSTDNPITKSRMQQQSRSEAISCWNGVAWLCVACRHGRLKGQPPSCASVQVVIEYLAASPTYAPDDLNDTTCAGTYAPLTPAAWPPSPACHVVTTTGTYYILVRWMLVPDVVRIAAFHWVAQSDVDAAAAVVSRAIVDLMNDDGSNILPAVLPYIRLELVDALGNTTATTSASARPTFATLNDVAIGLFGDGTRDFFGILAPSDVLLAQDVALLGSIYRLPVFGAGILATDVSSTTVGGQGQLSTTSFVRTTANFQQIAVRAHNTLCTVLGECCERV